MIELPVLDRAPSAVPAWSDPAGWHLFETEGRSFVYVADGSRVFELDGESRAVLQSSDHDDEPFARLTSLGIPFQARVTDEPLRSPQTRALSLAISQKCNLACSYCYAQEGSFGGPAKAMPQEVAFRAVDFLLAQAAAGDRVNLSFLGGEPLTARQILCETVEYAEREAEIRQVRIGFSITTNGTLVTQADAEFFAKHGFAVTVSLDGGAEIHDRLRPHKNGSGTFAAILKNIRPLLERQRPMQVSARVTVTPRNLKLPQTLLEFVNLGFHSVGFSPMLASPTGREELDSEGLEEMLIQMVDCGRLFEERTCRPERFPFSNMANAMAEIHRGTHRPYPCGAGAGYLGVSADGDLAACHRFVGDEAGSMGDLAGGVDAERQNHWLGNRHVHRQEPCSSCWARYLCGGGCHHEVIHRGRPACHYIRGWLEYCLGAYVRLQEQAPAYFEGLR